MSACRDRKGFWSFIAKLSRVVGTARASRIVSNVKGKRKLLSVQQAFLLDPSIAPSSAPSPVTPCFPFFSSQSSFSSPHFTSHTRSHSHPQRTAYSAPHSANGSPICIHKAPHSAPVSPEHIPHVDSHPEKKDSHTQPSPPLHANPSPLLASMASCPRSGECSAYGLLWSVILLALLCTFLCLGKEIAFVAATAAHFFLQVVLGHGSFHPDEPVEIEKIVGSNRHCGPLSRSTTIAHSRGLIIWTSIQWNRRSKSWTPLCTSAEGEMQPSEADIGVSLTTVSEPAGSPAIEAGTNGLVRRGNLCAGMKLQLALLFTLCGLFYGRSLAICTAVCSILICSKVEGLFSKRMYRA